MSLHHFVYGGGAVASGMVLRELLPKIIGWIAGKTFDKPQVVIQQQAQTAVDNVPRNGNGKVTTSECVRVHGLLDYRLDKGDSDFKELFNKIEEHHIETIKQLALANTEISKTNSEIAIIKNVWGI